MLFEDRKILFDDGSMLIVEVSAPDDPLFWSVQSSSVSVEWFSIASELRILTALPKRFRRGVIPHRVQRKFH